MEIKLADNLKIETNIPILHVEQFCYLWKPDCHASLKLEGYLDRNIRWNPEQSYDSRIKIWRENSTGDQIIYHGYIVKVEIKNMGGTSQIKLEALSASCLLDRRVLSSSFQNPVITFGEVVREAVQTEGGQVIRDRENDKEIKNPVIRYEETAWEFAKRLGRPMGNYIIPDIETGNPNIWFGMRKGKEVPALQEDQCIVKMCTIGRKTGIYIEAEGRTFYKIGDRMSYLGQNTTILEVQGRYERGELAFNYVLEDMSVHQPGSRYESNHAGLGLWGTVQDVKGETVKLALDIDDGKNTGDYFYPYCPETGNSLYAMPEKGARALLYFLGGNERNGTVIHCLNGNQNQGQYYKDRALDIENGNSLSLSKEVVSVCRGQKHRLTLDDDSVTIKTSKDLKIVAEGKIRLKSKRITVSTADELNICQG